MKEVALDPDIAGRAEDATELPVLPEIDAAAGDEDREGSCEGAGTTIVPDWLGICQASPPEPTVIIVVLP